MKSKVFSFVKLFLIVVTSIYFLYISFALFSSYEKSQDIILFLKTIWNYPIYQNLEFKLSIGKLIIEIGLIYLSFLGSGLFTRKVIGSVLNRTKMDLGAKSSILQLSGYLITFVFVVIALSIMNIPLGAFTFIGGALAIGTGFGSQNLINNFISGIIIQIEKPVKVGDTVTLENGNTGTVEEIGARSSKVLLGNNSFTIVPNSFLLEKSLINWDYRGQTRRSKIMVEINYKTNYKKAFDKISKILDTNEKILKTPGKKILITELRDNGYLVEILFWIELSDTLDQAKLESSIREGILDLNESGEIKIASNELKIKRGTN